jgi:undecaprenyl diphosphate synthase
MPEYFTPQRTFHVAVIMDGNGRWASARHLPRVFGHRAGVQTARAIIEAASRLGISTLTLYAFSSDNWRRPTAEVSALMLLFREFLDSEVARCREEGIRLSIIGRRDRLDPELASRIAQAERETAAGTSLHLRIAIDYSGREAIASGHVGPDVDLLIRSGGEHRLSDFLLWESAYAELYFTPCLWPDFGRTDLEAALRDFHHRDRRFGSIKPVPPTVQSERWLR